MYAFLVNICLYKKKLPCLPEFTILVWLTERAYEIEESISNLDKEIDKLYDILSDLKVKTPEGTSEKIEKLEQEKEKLKREYQQRGGTKYLKEELEQVKGSIERMRFKIFNTDDELDKQDYEGILDKHKENKKKLEEQIQAIEKLR